MRESTAFSPAAVVAGRDTVRPEAAPFQKRTLMRTIHPQQLELRIVLIS